MTKHVQAKLTELERKAYERYVAMGEVAVDE